MKQKYEMSREEQLYRQTENLPEVEWADDTAFDWFSLGVKMADRNPNWISVEDELPKTHIVDCGLVAHPVLVYRDDGFIQISRYDSEIDEWENCPGTVTHWMPLPNTPKKDQLSKEKEKELFKELCYRLPYNVIVNIKDKNTGKNYDRFLDTICLSSFGVCESEEIKPYLFSMSSMTKEQEQAFEEVNLYDRPYNLQGIEWLLEHHFDFRGMHDKGLAISPPENMYSI